MQILRSVDFECWLESESAKTQAIVESRIFRIERYDHFGDAKHLGDGLSELRWKSGLRVYFARVGARVVLRVCNRRCVRRTKMRHRAGCFYTGARGELSR